MPPPEFDRNKSRPNLALELLLLTAFLVGLPLLGVAAAGYPLARYLEFPPQHSYIDHAAFSWPGFTAIASVSLLLLGILVYLAFPRCAATPRPPRPKRAYPWWGWAAVAWLAVSWVLAWTRLPWFEHFQAFTFTPLWLGYIVGVNALTFRRTGHCLLCDRPWLLAALFPMSALFWWYFEYLNRFVQNWQYVGVEYFGTATYLLHATLAFSTVVPAVISTTEWLASFQFLRHGYSRPFSLGNTRHYAWLALAVAGAALLGLGVWPNYLFPWLWAAPMLVLVSIQVLSGENTWFHGLTKGRWELLYLPAFAALICGFFWELWNYHSEAKWIYHVPYAGSPRIFEMPLLGYVGYLPFGLECAVVADLVNRRFRDPADIARPTVTLTE